MPAVDHEAEKLSKKKADTELLEAVHRLALKRFDESTTADHTERERSISDSYFVTSPGSMWGSNRSSSQGVITGQGNGSISPGNRPRFEVNKISPIIENIVGEMINNRTSIKVRSARGGDARQTAENMGNVIRSITSQSNFDAITTQAYREAVTCGIGGWYLVPEYTDTGIEGTEFEQDIVIKPLPGAASSLLWDPSAVKQNKEDAQWMAVRERVSRETFASRYPDVDISDLGDIGNNQNAYQWQDRQTVQIVDYYVREPYIKELAQMSDGTILEITEESEMIFDELEKMGKTIVARRSKKCFKAIHYKIAQNGVLEGPHEIPSEKGMIPVVPLFGFTEVIDGNHFFSGIVRAARDASQIYNYAISAFVEHASQPVSPIWLTTAQVKGEEIERGIANMAVENRPVMVINHVEGMPLPTRTAQPQQPPGLMDTIRQAEFDISATSGYHAAAKGEAQFDQSGKAIRALQTQTNTSVRSLAANFDAAVARTGVLLLDMIPTIYHSDRVLNMIDESGEVSEWRVNSKVKDEQTGQTVIVNDLSIGFYDVVASTGPSFATQRAESVEKMLELASVSPKIAEIGMDIMAENVDMVRGDELTARLRKMGLADGTIEPNAEEAEAMQPQEPSELELLELESMKLDVEQKRANIAFTNRQSVKTDADTVHKNTQSSVNLSESIKKKVEANQLLMEQGSSEGIPMSPHEMEAGALIDVAILESIERVDDAVEPEQVQAQQPLPPEVPQ